MMCNGMSRYRMKTFIHFSCGHYINCIKPTSPPSCHLPHHHHHTQLQNKVKTPWSSSNMGARSASPHVGPYGHQIWAHTRLRLMWVLMVIKYGCTLGFASCGPLLRCSRWVKAKRWILAPTCRVKRALG